jgi:hypothetical protein
LGLSLKSEEVDLPQTQAGGSDATRLDSKKNNNKANLQKSSDLVFQSG